MMIVMVTVAMAEMLHLQIFLKQGGIQIWYTNILIVSV